MGVREKAKAKGMLKYCTGKSCKKGHFSERYASTGKCIDCNKLAKKEETKSSKFKKYGLTEKDYWELFWKQDGKCAICREAEIVINHKTGDMIALAIDHCHTSGRVRGLLCYQCNIGIGNLKHRPDLLRIAALYCEI